MGLNVYALSDAVEQPAPVTPEQLGPYRVTKILGRGGMGVVYGGVHFQTGEAVAIKTVPSIAPKLLSALRAEVQALKRVRHPGVVRILSDGLSDELPWYAMECLEGETLEAFNAKLWRDRVSPVSGAVLSGTLDTATTASETVLSPRRSVAPERHAAAGGDLRRALRHYRGVCRALDHIHRLGLIHRDLKPSNVFLKGGETPVLMDFGLASQSFGGLGREALAVDPQGRLNGTLPYLSPEQLRGELVDARADLYALGCMLYETVVGRPPFEGATMLSVIRAHIDESPVPPSRHVTDLPELLEALILQLLAKSPHDRIGRAEDADTLLAKLVDAVAQAEERSTDPYLYRPRLTGRDDALERIEAARKASIAGEGGVVLIGGESGIGKTFLVSEAARRAASDQTRVLTGECPPPAGSVHSDRAGKVPFAPFRSLLQYIADRCRQEGPETTERLLGARCRVLVGYEPSLSYVPGQGDYAEAPRLEASLAKRRILLAMEETLLAVAREAPLLLAIDDLQWADELTLELLHMLASKRLPSVLILGTFRSEEAEALRPLLDAGTSTIALSPLDPVTIRQLVADMLAIASPPVALVELIIELSEGNPFFAAEYLRLAVSEGLLSRAGDQWLTATRLTQGRSAPVLPLPRSIHQLTARRVATLDPPARALLEAAAVLGREFDSELVGSLLGGQEAVFDGIELLRRLQILQRTGENTFRFVHDRLREAVYDMVPPPTRRGLHTSAARVLELRHGWLPDAVDTYPRIAYHWANADQPQSASRYLIRSARHSKAAYANEDAKRLYGSAIQELGKARRDFPGDSLLCAATVSAQEDLGDLLMLSGLSAQAREAYESGLQLVDSAERETLARFWRKLGRTWAAAHRHAQALEALARAETTLPVPGQESISVSEWRERVEIRNEQIWSNYWLGDRDELKRLVADQRAVVEQIGTESQRANFFRALCLAELRQLRYRIQPSTVSYARGAWQAAQASHDPGEAASTRFNLGFVLMAEGSLAEAAEHMAQVAAAAERFGDVMLHVRALAYHSVIARLRKDTDLASSLAYKTKELATNAMLTHYLGIAQANLGWAEYAQGGHGTARQLLEAGLEIWRAPPVYPLQWLAILPLLDLFSLPADLREAQRLAAFLLEETQQQLPSTVETSLSRFATSGEASALREALQEARAAGYL